jgi:hypothetical protein
MSDTGNPPAPDPKPPEPPKPGEPEPEGEPKNKKPADQIRDLESALAEERKLKRAAESKLSTLEKERMTETEKLVAAAKAEGHQEALISAGRRLAAAEFKASAAGRIGDPDAALEVLDLSKFVGEDGEPDKAAITRVVDRLAAAMPPAPATGRVPAGPRSDNEDGGDFIRQAMQRR